MSQPQPNPEAGAFGTDAVSTVSAGAAASAGAHRQEEVAGAVSTGWAGALKALPAVSPTAQPVLADFTTSPGADLRDAGQADLAAIRREIDFFTFFGLFFPLPFATADYHGAICAFLSKWGRTDLPGGSPNFGHKRLGVQVSRDCGKTTIGTKTLSLWTLLNSPGYNARVAILNASEDNVSDWIRHIRRFVETSREFQLLWGDCLPPGVSIRDQERGIGVPKGWVWNNYSLEFVRSKVWTEPSISGYSVMASIAGRHFDYIIKDDLIGEKQAYSETECRRVEQTLHALRSLESPAEKGNDLFLYTRWHYSDPYAYLRKTWPDDYVIYDRSALITDPVTGQEFSSLPTKWSTAELQQMRSNPKKSAYFASQMQNRPRAGEDASFNAEWLRYCEFYDDPEGGYILIEPAFYERTISAADDPDDVPPRRVPLWCMTKFALWDPAPSEQRDKNKDEHARNGKLWCGLDPWGRLFVLEVAGTRRDPVDEMRETITKSLGWGCDRVGTEEVVFSKTYKHWGSFVMEKEFPRDHLTFTPLKEERRSKDARILGLIPDFRGGFVYLNRCSSIPMFVQEYLEYPYGSTRDILDALAMWRSVASRPPTVGELTKMNERDGAPMRPGQWDNINWNS